ncbi:MAG TPA: hypothetical protein VHN18_21400, partial [Micromonosporaceae bacterium]|nr:hypothetical protein [Micromonosporaceae bacterium]
MVWPVAVVRGLVIKASALADHVIARVLRRAVHVAARLYGKARARANEAQAAAAAGDTDRARRLFAQAETIARTISDRFLRAEALAGLAQAVAAAGDQDRGERIAGTIRAPFLRVRALA